MRKLRSVLMLMPFIFLYSCESTVRGENGNIVREELEIKVEKKKLKVDEHDLDKAKEKEGNDLYKREKKILEEEQHY